MNNHFAANQLTRLADLAGVDQWHTKPLYSQGDVLERVVRATASLDGNVILWLENGDTVSVITDEAHNMIWSCVEQFASSEDEILEWLGQ